MKKKLIAVLGGEGSGKSTQLHLLRKKYSEGQLVLTREPGGSVFGEKIRALALSPDAKGASAHTQFGLMWAARHDHMEQLILPALNEGKHVITDRFDCCSYAYQVFAQGGTDLKDLFWQVREVFLKNRKPDLYIFLDVEPEVGLTRVAKRKGSEVPNHFDQQKLDFHQRIRVGYQDFLSRVPHVVIDANRSQEEVTKEFAAAVDLALAA